MPDWSYRKALNEALHAEFRADPDVFTFGLDVDDHKSIFGSTEGLLKKFGSDRVFGTPLSEDAMTGFAIGAALGGKKPVHVHIRADFALLATNQIINMASNLHYLTAGALSVPLTIRVVIGRGWGQGLQHSKTVHSLFSHFPGLKVMVPSSPQDAYTLLRKAIQDPNPVLFLEHRWLYDVEGPVDENLIDTSPVTLLRSGSDVTIVASSWMCIEALKAAEILEKSGIQAEILNLRSVAPLKAQAIYNSVKKTSHCLVTDHDWVEFGLASEIAACVQEHCFANLRQPVMRLGYRAIPCPTSRPLEDMFYPKAPDIISTVCRLLGKKIPDLSHYEFYSYENRFRGPF